MKTAAYQPWHDAEWFKAWQDLAWKEYIQRHNPKTENERQHDTAEQRHIEEH